MRQIQLLWVFFIIVSLGCCANDLICMSSSVIIYSPRTTQNSPSSKPANSGQAVPLRQLLIKPRSQLPSSAHHSASCSPDLIPQQASVSVRASSSVASSPCTMPDPTISVSAAAPGSVFTFLREQNMAGRLQSIDENNNGREKIAHDSDANDKITFELQQNQIDREVADFIFRQIKDLQNNKAKIKAPLEKYGIAHYQELKNQLLDTIKRGLTEYLRTKYGSRIDKPSLEKYIMLYESKIDQCKIKEDVVFDHDKNESDESFQLLNSRIGLLREPDASQPAIMGCCECCQVACVVLGKMVS